VIRGSALKALEGEASDIGMGAIQKLMEALDAYIPQPQRDVDRPFLMPVEDVFSISGRGTVATGRIERGKVKVGEEIEIVGILADGIEFEELYGPGAHESHAFHAVAAPGGPDSWEHAVSGTGMDSGLVYVCRWVPLDECPPLWGDADPLVERLRVSITEL
jgi:hypothetical protein